MHHGIPVRCGEFHGEVIVSGRCRGRKGQEGGGGHDGELHDESAETVELLCSDSLGLSI